MDRISRKLGAGGLPRLLVQNGKLEAVLTERMHEVTQIRAAIEQGDPHAPERLLPLVYDALRKLASQRMAQEALGQKLQATALVHEVGPRRGGRVTIGRRYLAKP